MDGSFAVQSFIAATKRLQSSSKRNNTLLSEDYSGFLLLNRNNLYIDCLLTAIYGLNDELNLLVLVQSTKTLSNDSGVVDEYLLTILTDNESVALFAIKPFYFANHSVCVLIVNMHSKIKDYIP